MCGVESIQNFLPHTRQKSGCYLLQQRKNLIPQGGEE
jgi:hypothetical protein